MARPRYGVLWQLAGSFLDFGTEGALRFWPCGPLGKADPKTLFQKGIEQIPGNDSSASTFTVQLGTGEHRLSIKRPEGAEAAIYYRRKAQEMLRQAETATSHEARAVLLNLADHWHRLAQAIEEPNQ